ncbi:uncharacterized protein [Manis javanica]|uniref:uncharacterized protein isoform X3 n=1 Tax=Manis javanica TaxID=9974 RepID=UPI003C6DB363
MDFKTIYSGESDLSYHETQATLWKGAHGDGLKPLTNNQKHQKRLASHVSDAPDVQISSSRHWQCLHLWLLFDHSHVKDTSLESRRKNGFHNSALQIAAVQSLRHRDRAYGQRQPNVSPVRPAQCEDRFRGSTSHRCMSETTSDFCIYDSSGVLPSDQSRPHAGPSQSREPSVPALRKPCSPR